MAVRGKGFTNIRLSHDGETYAVDKSPAFVTSVAIELQPRLKQLFINMNDVSAFLTMQLADEPMNFLAKLGSSQGVSHFAKNQVCS